MKGFRVVLQHKENGDFKDMGVVARKEKEALDLAREYLNDTEKDYILYDLYIVEEGVVMVYSHDADLESIDHLFYT